jgi:hypothetical protein
MTTRSRNEYEWKCDRCCAVNVESDPVCWWCNAHFIDEPLGDVFVPKSAARRDEDIVDAIVDHMMFGTRHITRLSALHAVTRGLVDHYGQQLTDKALAKYRCELEQQKRGLERQLAGQERRQRRQAG